ncbi:RNA-directed DNA polymerase, eukaryota, reverse transcriptase zinc-binding domain protein [Tanacetum coccineum]
MRNQRNSKIPQKFDNTIHSINSKTNKKNVSKNKNGGIVNDVSRDLEGGNGVDTDVRMDGCVAGDPSVNQVDCNDKEGEEYPELESTGMLNNEGNHEEFSENYEKQSANANSVKNGCNNENNGDVRGSDQIRKDAVSGEEDALSSKKESEKGNRMSYASKVKQDEVPKNLNYIPTLITDDGNEVVIFDDMLVQRGSERWNLTVYGQFVGYNMNIHELRYNVRRMWSKFGIAEIDVVKKGHYVFKFKNLEGLNAVLDKGPWMVRNKPLFLKRWCPDIGMEKMEPKKLPVWVKMVNVPLEAWTMEGISALASSLGKPIMMDASTANMCHNGFGNIEYARVLVEMDSEKDRQCKKGSKGRENGNEQNRCDGEMRGDVQGPRKNANRWNYVGNEPRKQNHNQSKGGMNWRDPDTRRQEYRKKQTSDMNKNESTSGRNKWNVKEKEVVEIRKTANKYFVLDSLPEDNDQELRMLKDRMIVDKFLNKNLQPSPEEAKAWSRDMIQYFKDKWEEKRQSTNEDESEDVINISSGSAKIMSDNEIHIEKQNEIRNLVQSEKLQVCAILETRLKNKKFVQTCDRVFNGWEWTSNMLQCSKGCRIVIGWNDDTNVQVLHKTDQVIFCTINSAKNNVKCFFSFVYAENEGSLRRALWSELCREKHIVNGRPWCLAGDMNVTLHPNEHSCGSSVLNADMLEFKECLNEIEVEDLCSSGLHYTWTKNLHKAKVGIMTGVLKKLDRILTNEEFITQFPQANAKFLPYIISDHSSSILSIPSSIQKKIKSFRFSNYLTEKQDFILIVSKNWNQNIQGHYMYQVVKKLKSLKSPLNKLSWSKGNIFKRVEEMRIKLKEVQISIDSDPHNHQLRDQEAMLVKEFFEAEADEEKFLYQQAKIKWLCDGDKNSKYFHSVLKGRRSKSKIHSIKDKDGITYEGEQIPNVFLKHFQEFLGTKNHVQEIASFENMFRNKLRLCDAEKMIRDVSDKEIKDAIFDIDDAKAPGPDGFSAAFFKKSWNVIGSDICMAVKEFFMSGRLLGEVNVTLISLIPKIQTPNKVTDFRPIACCNVLYKCISKVLTNRIKPILGKLGYNRRGGPKRVAFKIDIQKAYDTVNWEFLEKTLSGFGFHKRMIKWIMQCVTTVAFTLNINGERIGYFKGGKGLRQGDPISPYLFTLVMEVFSLILLKEIEEEPNFQYHFGCKAIKFSHVCFADDLLVMCHGDPTSATVIKKDLEQFSTCSGKLPVRYLGVPLIAKRLGVNECGCLVDKIKSRIHNWKNRYLSYAGRLQLIAVVLESIHVYWALVPKDKGGLRLKNLQTWNYALLSKHVWNIATKKDSLWVKWVHSVKLRGKSFWEIKEEKEDSWGWKNLLIIRDQVKDNIFYKVGNGTTTSLWYDNWSNIGPLFQYLTHRDLYDERLSENLTVKDMIVNGRWNWPEEWYVKFPAITGLEVPIIDEDSEDSIVWKARLGDVVKFSMRQVNFDLSNQYPNVLWWKLIWYSQCIPKHSFILWLAMLNKLTTQDRLKKWGNQDVNRCCLCLNDSEDLKHLFFKCSYAKKVWGMVLSMTDIDNIKYEWEEIIHLLINAGNGNNINSVCRRLMLGASVYNIWNERNRRIFQDKKLNEEDIVKRITEVVKCKLSCLIVKDSAAVRKMEDKWSISCKRNPVRKESDP